MKAVISSTYDDKYFFFLPIVIWCWNKLGIDVICFVPEKRIDEKVKLVTDTIINNCGNGNTLVNFKSPLEKEATYAQCSRLYGSCLDLPKEEVLIAGDVDMLVFGEYLKQKYADFDIFGGDLVCEKQIPICYISASVENWRKAMQVNNRTYQECLDELVGIIECNDFRGNQWSLDQGTAYQMITSAPVSVSHHLRAIQGTQFASNRIDRENVYWEERLTPNIIDAHLWRPGYTDENFPKILKVLKYFYQNDDFNWLIEYTEAYKRLLNPDSYL